MARNNDGDRVLAIGGADRSHRVRIAELACELPVAARFAKGNPEQRMPYIELEPGSDQLQLQRKRFSIALEILLQLAFGLKEDWVIVICGERGRGSAFRPGVVPKDGEQAVVPCDQLQISDG